MYELPAKPSHPVHGDLGGGYGKGVVGLRCGSSGPTVRMFDSARAVLQELLSHPGWQASGVQVALASSSEEPSYSAECIAHLEIIPGKTIADLVPRELRQVGRTGKLSSDKRTHFLEIHRALDGKVDWSEMVFMDDSNWGDHVGHMESAFGIIGQRTPRGLTMEEWRALLAKFDKERGAGKSSRK